jgi:hypothetical protein
MRFAANKAVTGKEIPHGIDLDYRCVSALVWRRRRILGSQARYLVTRRVPAFKREQRRLGSPLSQRIYRSIGRSYLGAVHATLFEPTKRLRTTLVWRFICAPGHFNHVGRPQRMSG